MKEKLNRAKNAKFDDNSIFNPSNPVSTLRNLTNMDSKEIVTSLLDKINMNVDGG